MFIVLEALDAGGSQTQTDRLAARMKKEGYNVLQLHFPQEDRMTGRMVYDKFLLSKNKPGFSRREQALLYIQDFYSRWEDINGHLNERGGNVVVSDRFYTSTLAYQTMGLTGRERATMLSWLKLLTEKRKPCLRKPDLVILLDTPAEISVKHLEKKKKDYFETKQRLQVIRTSYLRLAQEEKWIVIKSANEKEEQRTIDDIHAEIWQSVQLRFKLR